MEDAGNRLESPDGFAVALPPGDNQGFNSLRSVLKGPALSGNAVTAM